MSSTDISIHMNTLFESNLDMEQPDMLTGQGSFFGPPFYSVRHEVEDWLEKDIQHNTHFDTKKYEIKYDNGNIGEIVILHSFHVGLSVYFSYGVSQIRYNIFRLPFNQLRMLEHKLESMAANTYINIPPDLLQNLTDTIYSMVSDEGVNKREHTI